ncbi:MAG: plastocyanin/azurin family copper-binding protein [Methanococcaceae archaeon]
MKKFKGSKSRVFISTAILLATISIFNSCSKNTDYNTPGPGPGSKGGPGTNEVWIQGMAFSPATITVSAGTTIKWTNKDAVSHTVTSDTGLFDSGSLASGATYSQKFETAGTFPYHCALHTGMKATVVVN